MPPNTYSRDFVAKRLQAISKALARATVGDFSGNLKLPKTNDEFSELQVGVQMMLEVVRQQTGKLEELNQALEEKVDEVARDLVAAQRVAKIGSWSRNLKTGEVRWSRQMHRIFEVPLGQKIDPDIVLNMIEPAERDRVRGSIDAAIAANGRWRLEYAITTPRGNQRYVRAIGQVEMQNRRPVRICGTAQDVTELRQAEAELTRTGQQFRRLVDGVKDYAIYQLDADGVVQTWNVGAHRMTGYAADEIIGQHFAVFYSPEAAAAGKPADELRAAAAEGRSEQEGCRVRKDGQRFLANMLITPLHDDANQLSGFSVVIRDVTEQHKVNNRQREFISIASHELRTPITALTGYLAMLRDEINQYDLPADAKLPHFAKRSFESAQRISGLVEDLLNVARIEEDRLHLQPQVIAPTPQIDQVVESIRPRADLKSIRLTVENRLTPRHTIKTDPLCLERVIFNLIENAVKYTPDGGRVEVAARVIGDQVSLTISDTGVGIQPENLNRIFDKFFREYTVLSTGAGGTGLGLFITKQLIERQNGTIEIKSQPDQGTEATVAFPLAAVKDPVPAAKC